MLKVVAVEINAFFSREGQSQEPEFVFDAFKGPEAEEIPSPFASQKEGQKEEEDAKTDQAQKEQAEKQSEAKRQSDKKPSVLKRKPPPPNFKKSKVKSSKREKKKTKSPADNEEEVVDGLSEGQSIRIATTSEEASTRVGPYQFNLYFNK